jgi:hypothetical protein
VVPAVLLRSSVTSIREVCVAQLNVDEFLERFRDRAASVRERGIPPLEGEARRTFIASAEQDYLDYSLVGSASWEVEDDNLVLRIPIG